MTDPLHRTPLERARLSLDGLSVGDAFGERFVMRPDVAAEIVASRVDPAPPWVWTDDTNMAVSVVSVLARHGAVDQGALAADFASRYDPARGYGAAMHGLLMRIRDGEPWDEAAQALFHGQGSYGNGAAMRAAPVGAWYASDLEIAAEQAARSAEITHAHADGIAGAVAVAVAAALAWRGREEKEAPAPADLLDAVLDHVPDGEVYHGLLRAKGLDGATPAEAAEALGNGSRVSARDTAPFALWCASTFPRDYEGALWAAAGALGDGDTICAIVGGIVALSAPDGSIPDRWLAARERLPVIESPADGQ